MKKPERNSTRTNSNGTRSSRNSDGKDMRITVEGYKSIFEQQEVEIRPLTLLSGANSAGKSSMFQPLLLLKQTLEENYDPGALLLNGNNVKFTAADQMLWKQSGSAKPNSFSIGIKYDSDELMMRFQKQQNKGFDVSEMVYHSEENPNLRLTPEMTSQQIKDVIPEKMREITSNLFSSNKDVKWVVARDRCFLGIGLKIESDMDKERVFSLGEIFSLSPLSRARKNIRELIHLPGLRGNPERTYPVTAVGSAFPGTFENYTASVIAGWSEQDEGKLEELCEDLRRLNLTSKVTAKRVNDAQVELQVGRLPELPKGRKKPDMVNIADVGFGMSQTLPVIVALHAARPGQIVYIEQPELHLHPRAQVAMARVLSLAAKRGVRVVCETHSSLILMGVQTLIAEGDLSSELVKLHWFERKNGSTQVTAADLDSAGRFGDWPVDFDDVSLETQSRYLDAAEERLARI